MFAQDNYDSRPFIDGVRFNCYPELTAMIGNDLGASFTWTFGCRIFDYGFVGFGIGIVDWIYDDYIGVPLTFNMRGFYPINRNTHPFVEFSIGKSIGLTYNYIPTKLSVGMGFDFARFSLGWGFTSYSFELNKHYSGTLKSNNFYLKLGIKIGKRD